MVGQAIPAAVRALAAAKALLGIYLGALQWSSAVAHPLMDVDELGILGECHYAEREREKERI